MKNGEGEAFLSAQTKRNRIDVMTAGSRFPVYLYATYGLDSQRKARQPVYYAFAGKSIADCLYNRPYMHIGAGARTTIAVVSMGFEASWLHVWQQSAGRYSDVFSATAHFDLGGWWAFGLRDL